MKESTRRWPLFWALCALVCVLLSACGGAEYQVTLDPNYPGAEAQTQAMSAAAVKEQTPERAGYMFEGWYLDALLSQPWDQEKLPGDVTLYAAWDRDTGDTASEASGGKDFASLRTPGSQEDAYEYQTYFIPAIDSLSQPYVGDTMPFYEDGVYYIYYLKEAGDSYNHSVYLATTTDFVTYEEYDEPVLEASRSGGQDSWIGTGSVVKLDDDYCFFYTGHADGSVMEYQEKILLAVGEDPYHFEKRTDWELIPPDSLGQKRDFRDPQAYYDPETDTVSLTVTAAQDGVARVLQYTLSADLTEANYEGIIYTNAEGDFWNLECSDTFRLGDTWYLTYSAQDDTLWYAEGESQFGPYEPAKRMEGALFYAAKHVEDGEGSYMVGWARRSESPSSTTEVSGWAGNLVVQQLAQSEDGGLYLCPVDTVASQFTARRTLAVEGSHTSVEAGARYAYADAFADCPERFLLTGDFRFTRDGSFGLCFDFNGREDKYKFIEMDPAEGKLKLSFNQGSAEVAETAVTLEPEQDYSFTYIQEGSVGVFYLDGQAALTVRLYGVSGKPIQVFAENNAVSFTSLRQYTEG